jgi:hypothetical protein
MSSTTFRKVLRSIPQKAQSPIALTDADLGALYSRESSPNASDDFRVFFTSPSMMI